MRDILSRRHSLLCHGRAMFTQDVALPLKSGCPNFHSHSLSSTHLQIAKDLAIKKVTKNRRTFLRTVEF